MLTADNERERFYNVIKRGETTKLTLGNRQVFVGELNKFLANFISINVFTVLLIVIMAVG